MRTAAQSWGVLSYLHDCRVPPCSSWGLGSTSCSSQPMAHRSRHYARSAGLETPRPLAVDRTWMEEMLVEELRTRWSAHTPCQPGQAIPAAAHCGHQYPPVN